MREKGNFILNATACHLVTYIICAMLFTAIFNKPAMISGQSADFMRTLTPGIVALGVFMELIRGVILAIILMLLQPIYKDKALGFIKVWFILAALTIFCPGAPAPGSLSGIAYGKFGAAYSFTLIFESLIQTGLLSLFVCSDALNRILRKMSTYQTSSLITALIGGLVYCATHLALMSITKAPANLSVSRVFDALLIFAIIIGAFFVSLWFLRSDNKFKLAVSAGLYYLLFALVPMAFNYASNSPVATPWILLMNFLVVGAVVLCDIVFSSKLSR